MCFLAAYVYNSSKVEDKGVLKDPGHTVSPAFNDVIQS